MQVENGAENGSTMSTTSQKATARASTGVEQQDQRQAVARPRIDRSCRLPGKSGRDRAGNAGPTIDISGEDQIQLDIFVETWPVTRQGHALPQQTACDRADATADSPVAMDPDPDNLVVSRRLQDRCSILAPCNWAIRSPACCCRW